MAIVAGIDEAGYGPVLGPLVAGAVAFRVPDSAADGDLWELFREGISRNAAKNPSLVRVADSKLIHRPGSGLGALERNVLPFVAALYPPPGTVGEFLLHIHGAEMPHLRDYPWYGDLSRMALT